MSYNSDELVAPDWVNGDFLKTVLEFNGDKKNVSILDFKITPGSGKGDHFSSILFRATITYSTETKDNQTCSVIIKTQPVVEGMKKEMSKQTGIDIFAGETFMYTKVLNQCAEVLQNAGFRDMLAPKILYHATKPHKVIAFEDLKPLGYFMFPGVVSDRSESEMIFNKLGQYHAAVYKLEQEGQEDLTKIKGTLFNMTGIEKTPLLANGIFFLHRMLTTLPDFEAAVVKLAKINMQKLMKKCTNTLNKPGGYNLLNHGDFHLKNTMFSIDFQLCHWGSPAYDLYYMAGVLPYEVRERYFRSYFDTFIDVLLRSGFKGYFPTYEQLQNDLKAYRHLELFLLCTITVFMRVGKVKIEGEVEEAMKNPEMFSVAYTNPRYVSYVKKALPALMEAGVLDDPDIIGTE